MKNEDQMLEWDFVKREVPWTRKDWAGKIYNAPVTFSRPASEKLVKKVQAAEFGLCTVGSWSREGLVNCVYNCPAFPARILTDQELIDRSARAGREPLVWAFRERAFLRYWDIGNNDAKDPGALFLSMLCDESQDLLSGNGVTCMKIMQRTAAELVSWFGSPTGIYLAKLGLASTGLPLLAAWDHYNNSGGNANNPLLRRVLSARTLSLLTSESAVLACEVMAANAIAWLDAGGVTFFSTVVAAAEAEAQSMKAKIRKERLLLQTSRQLLQPTDYERALILKEEEGSA